MMQADNSQYLVHAAQFRRNRTLQRAIETLEQTERQRRFPTVAKLAAEAGVSQSCLHTQPQLLVRLQQAVGSAIAVSSAAKSGTDRSSPVSLQCRQDFAHDRNRRLEDELRLLRGEFARALGQRRPKTQYGHAPTVARS